MVMNPCIVKTSRRMCCNDCYFDKRENGNCSRTRTTEFVFRGRDGLSPKMNLGPEDMGEGDSDKGEHGRVI